MVQPELLQSLAPAVETTPVPVPTMSIVTTEPGPASTLPGPASTTTHCSPSRIVPVPQVTSGPPSIATHWSPTSEVPAPHVVPAPASEPPASELPAMHVVPTSVVPAPHVVFDDEEQAMPAKRAAAAVTNVSFFKSVSRATSGRGEPRKRAPNVLHIRRVSNGFFDPREVIRPHFARTVL